MTQTLHEKIEAAMTAFDTMGVTLSKDKTVYGVFSRDCVNEDGIPSAFIHVCGSSMEALDKARKLAIDKIIDIVRASTPAHRSFPSPTEPAIPHRELGLPPTSITFSSAGQRGLVAQRISSSEIISSGSFAGMTQDEANQLVRDGI